MPIIANYTITTSERSHIKGEVIDYLTIEEEQQLVNTGAAFFIAEGDTDNSGAKDDRAMFEEMTNEEIKYYAKMQGIKLPSKANRPTMIEKIFEDDSEINLEHVPLHALQFIATREGIAFGEDITAEALIDLLVDDED